MVRHAILLSALLHCAALFGAGPAAARQVRAAADGQLVFNNACRTCPSTKPTWHRQCLKGSAEERAKIVAFLKSAGGSIA